MTAKSNECPHTTRFQLTLVACALAVICATAWWWTHVRLHNEYMLTDTIMTVMGESDTAFIVTDRFGTVLAWSKGAEKMFDVTSTQAIGGDVEFMIPPEMRPDHRAAIAAAEERGGVSKGLTVIKCDVIGARNRRFSGVITIRSVPYGNGRIRYVTQINRADDVETRDLTMFSQVET